MARHFLLGFLSAAALVVACAQAESTPPGSQFNNAMASTPPPRGNSSSNFALNIRTRRGSVSERCCPTNHNYCGRTLDSLCPQYFENNSLYSCGTNEAPIRIRACPGGCRSMAGTNDVCINDDLPSGLCTVSQLLRGQTLWSSSKNTKLTLQEDGNLVVYRVESGGNVPVWTTGTSVMKVKPTSVNVLPCGDLVMGNAEGDLIWRLGTAGRKFQGSLLRVFDADGGKFCLVDEDETSRCIWSSR